MVGFVVVSHSHNLAESVVELTRMMADGVPIIGAGGLEDGSFGTSFDKISRAIDKIYSEDGIIILVDMGSAVMTAEMVIESMADRTIKIADCPLVEGAIAGTIDSISGLSINEILDNLTEIGSIKKL
ncbi:MAG: PTS-dependent dihydroxyacetone kinase phosphotransferase subunit DhaM [Clostridiaceae bacterium]|jgi:dihydroxyacetone kinase phosphotransfer subunit|nr:PTS-dependent dihydroxyacetone kinase phosphotransferase subunit DhaM [Clostridiaceae bacterium]